MPNIMVVNTPDATMSYDSDRGIVHHQIHRPLSTQDFRTLLDTGTTLLQENGAQKWLSDDRGHGPVSTEDSEWAMADWLPRALQAGWKYWALVVPHDAAARANMADVISSFYERGLRIQVFSNPDEAWEWIEEL